MTTSIERRLIARHQVFEWREASSGQVFAWDVTLAEKFRGNGFILMTTVAERDQMEAVKRNNEWDPLVVARADPSIHGIGAPIVKDGAIAYILIDGTHRCVRALETGVPFEVDLLTDEVAAACQIPVSTQLWTVR